ncbi:MAG: FAD-dependent oxidoreductase [Bacteroidetes bacterium]|nr:MAG: FAD-dependent oxidoreductase [Bacteroidota bacterium]
MNRKEFLEKLTLAFSASIFSSSSLFSMDTDKFTDKESEIIVIGAGIAGLACAKLLTQNGYKVIILEGRNRIGGRIWTDRTTGVPLDMGASWIHGPKGNNPITPIAEKIKAEMYCTKDDNLVVYAENGQIIPDEKMDKYYNQYNQIIKKAKQNGNSAKSLAEAIKSVNPSVFDDIIMQYQFSAYTEFDYGGALELMSSKYYDEDERFAGKDVLFPNGYDAIPNHLAKDLDIRLNQIVNQIDYNQENIKITTTKDTFKAKYVVVTVPLGVLKKNTINFLPALPLEKQKIIKRLPMGTVNKVFLEFSECFWDEKIQYFGYAGKIKGQYNYFLNAKKFVPNKNILLTFGFGSYGLTMEKQTDAQIQNDIMIILKKIYGNKIPNPQKIKVSRWNNDVFSYGAYSFAGVNCDNDDFDNLGKSVAQKLFFAGEHTHTQYRGTVHGAYLSGVRVAKQMMEKEEEED